MWMLELALAASAGFIAGWAFGYSRRKPAPPAKVQHAWEEVGN